MDGQRILITGTTGHIGFSVLKYALQHGFSVRAAVRSQAKAEIVRSNVALQALQKDDRLDFVVVPNMVADGAFDEAVKGVAFIIHCASPIPFSKPTTDNGFDDFVKPAVGATLGLLRSASKERGIKRVVITSSLAAIAPLAAATTDLGETYTADTRQAEPNGVFEPGTPSFAAYAAGKISALNQAEAWMKETQPDFDLIHIMPSFVLGRNDLYQTVADMQASPHALVLSVIAGEGGMPPTCMTVCHIDDCARIHVQALEPEIKGGQSFFITTRAKWDDAKAIVEKRLPEAVKDGRLLNAGSLVSVNVSYDVKKTEDTFGIERSYEDMVVSVAEQYLELAGRGGMKTRQ